MSRTFFAVALALAMVQPVVAHAQDLRYGAWEADLSNASVATEATTVNQSGSRFGFICVISISQCTYYISAHTTCEPGSTSAVLINTDAGTLMSKITCTKLSGSYYNAIQDTADLHRAVTASNTIGIAIPMENGHFKVVRFSLAGANAAIYAVSNAAAASETKVDHMQ
jgi:hypothetical protein